MDIYAIRKQISNGNILWTSHLALRLRERGIRRADVIASVQNGMIIESYPDDEPYPSCLILGVSTVGKPLHVVCAINPVSCCMITAYHPDPEKWETDFRTRKNEV